MTSIVQERLGLGVKLERDWILEVAQSAKLITSPVKMQKIINVSNV